jgi:hypothetical protein
VSNREPPLVFGERQSSWCFLRNHRIAKVAKAALPKAGRERILNTMSVEELASVVSGLSANDLARFSQWFKEFMADQWDRQIERDIKAGRLDTAVKRADERYQAGRCAFL